MYKKFLKLIWRRRLFSLAIISLVIAIILSLLGIHNVANLILAVVSIIEVIPLLIGMYQDIREGSYGIDILAATAIIASVLLKEYWAAIMVVIMLTGGETLEDYAEHRSKRELDNLLKGAPAKAHLIKNNKQFDVKVSEINVGDKIIIKPGELVPVDAIVIDGGSSFNEASLTGESNPVSKNEGDKLLSGSVNLEGLIMAKATATSEDSQYQQIVKLVQGAAASKAPFVRLADQYSIPFTIIAYAIAVAVWVFTGEAIRFLEVIIVATPCPLLLAAPIALISGMSLSSKYGIIVKTGSALERLAEAKTIAFDKTGTLTSGNLSIDKVWANKGYTEKDVLAYAAALEQYSGHIIARAINEGAKKSKLKLPKVKGVKEVPGYGMSADFKGKDILLGKLGMMDKYEVNVPANLTSAKVNDTSLYVALGDSLIGHITLKDSLRQETKATLSDLRSQGIEDLMMVTGDNEKTAGKIAKEIGISNYIADALPRDKLLAIESIKNRPVVFVGDGVNDAPVLTASDVGIALGARGSTAASESADMVIMLDDISRVAYAVRIARHTFKIAKQSILIGIGLSIVLMIAFSTGHFQPLLGAILQEVVDVFVIFNALRAHTIKLQLIA